MLRVGEESGSLKEIFFELYQIFDERFKNSIKRVLTLLEPLIIIVMGSSSDSLSSLSSLPS